MPKTLVIIAHPDLRSSRVNSSWYGAITGLPSVSLRDLYSLYPGGEIDIKSEQWEIEQHDHIVLQFPFQWYSCPALLKQWIDEVFESGWAYGDGGNALEGKTLTIAVSTWSRASDYERNGRYGRSIEDLTCPFEVTALRVGMLYQPGFFLHGIGDLTDEALATHAARYRAFVCRQ